jgi:hypothetical protein
MNRFGISTHLFHEQRLNREHLVHIAAHGFEAIELFATRTHFDYHDAQAAAQLAEWLSDTQLELHSVHAPIVESLKGGRWVWPSISRLAISSCISACRHQSRCRPGTTSHLRPAAASRTSSRWPRAWVCVSPSK